MRLDTAAFQYLCFHSALKSNNLFASALLENNVPKFGTVAANEFVDPSLGAVGETTFDESASLPALAGLSAMDIAGVDNPFGPSGTPLGDNGPVTVDSRSGVVSSINLAKPILPGNGAANSLLWSVGALPEADNIHGAPEKHHDWEALAEQAVKNWMNENESFLGVNSHDELFSPGRTRLAVHGDGDMIQLSIQRTHHDIPVRGNRATATIKMGNLINVGFEQWGAIPKELDINPSITVQDAFDALELHAGLDVVRGQENCKPELQILTMAKGTKPPAPTGTESQSLIRGIFGGTRGLKNKKDKKKQNKGADDDTASFGDGYTYSLVWKICPIFVGQQQEIMEGFVDAHTSQVYSFVDKVDYFNAVGSVYPTTNDGQAPDGVVQEDWPMPFMEVGNEVTTTGGNYFNSGFQTARFYGPYVNMADNCGTDSLSGDGGIDWQTSGGTDCTTPGVGGAGNTHSSRTGFYELNKMKEIARSRLPNNTWLQGRLTANMNINNSCNAFWNGSTINFYRSGGGCGNTGENAAIFDHEWGHGMDANDVNGGIASPSGEGIADLYSALRLGDSCIGRGFFSDGTVCTNGGTCTECTGVRDIDYAKKTKNKPFTHTESNNICGGGVHCVGYVYAEAVWDLYKRHLQASPYNYDDNTALEIVTRLTYIAAGNIATWFSGTPGQSGCGNNSGFRAFLEADDDDGNVSNGTPHMNAIFNAFNSHQIACPKSQLSLPANDFGCAGAPTIQPEVTAQAGNMGVTLTWNSVPGAEKYQVLRTEGVFGCSQGKVLLGEPTGTTWTDSGLQNERDYYYIVVPKGSDGNLSNESCYGPSSECKHVQPVGMPEFLVSCASEPVAFDQNSLPDSDSRECSISSFGGWEGTVTLECDSSALGGISCAIPSSVTITSSQTQVSTFLQIDATSSASKDEGSITISAKSGSMERASSVNVRIFGGDGPQVAIYDGGMGSPRCLSFGSECSSAALLRGRGTKGPELNAPNTMNEGNCDGGSGSYMSDESLETIIVTAPDGNNMVEGGLVTVTASVFAWSTGSSDRADFYYASDASDPSWTFIKTVAPSRGGMSDLQVSYTLPAGAANQAVRVNFRYNGSASTCSGGSYDDADTLVFAVEKENATPPPTVPATPPPTKSPSRPPTFSPTKIPTGSPTNLPTSSPSVAPTSSPTMKPIAVPTTHPTPGPTGAPTTANPTKSPSGSPSLSPTGIPSGSPTDSPSVSPSTNPTNFPTTSPPTESPTGSPTASPTTDSPSVSPSTSPTKIPTESPSGSPTFSPTESPTGYPTSTPSTSSPTLTPSANPTKNPIVGGGVQIAAFDTVFKAPRCVSAGGECNPEDLLLGRGGIGPEAGSPNTIDGCQDGSSGSFHSDESVDKVVVRAGEVDGTGAEGDMTEGYRATIIANVWAWSSGASDRVDFYYASDATSPVWEFIGTLTPPGGGAQELKMAYTLPAGKDQAVRVGIRYLGTRSPCPTGNWNDRDDLVFTVQGSSSTAPPTKAPTPGGISTPQVATYDNTLGVPLCSKIGNECDSVDLVKGRGTITNGNEANEPNTLDSCSDGDSGTANSDESLDRIVVRSGEIDGTGAENDLTEGGRATITATVYAWSSGSSDRADFYYANDLNNPDWVLIDTVVPTAGGVQELQASYTIPPGGIQAVRVNFRYTGTVGACTTGDYDERDDLAFAVRQAAVSLSGWIRPLETETKEDVEPTYSETKPVDKKEKKKKKKKDKGKDKKFKVKFV